MYYLTEHYLRFNLILGLIVNWSYSRHAKIEGLMIIVFTLPAMGHVKPMMPLLERLVGEGQKIICFGHKNFEEVISATGAEFLPYPDISYNVDAPDFNLVKMGADLINASEIIYSALLPQIKALTPKLILQDSMALWASRIGTALDIPRVHTIPTLLFNKAAEQQMRKEDGIIKLISDVFHGLPHLLMAKLKTKLEISIGEAFGIERSWNNLSPPICELVFCIEALQVGQPYGSIQRYYIGPSYMKAKEIDSNSNNGYALISFGTLSNNETKRFEAAITGAFNAGYSVVAQCGEKVNQEHLKTIAISLEAKNQKQTVKILGSVKDLERLISDADIVIHHAGMATTWEAVRRQKPALFIPTIADQKVLATMLEKQGIGIRLKSGSECDHAAIESALVEVRNQDYPWANINQLLEDAGGANKGVQVILELLEEQT